MVASLLSSVWMEGCVDGGVGSSGLVMYFDEDDDDDDDDDDEDEDDEDDDEDEEVVCCHSRILGICVISSAHTIERMGSPPITIPSMDRDAP